MFDDGPLEDADAAMNAAKAAALFGADTSAEEEIFGVDPGNKSFLVNASYDYESLETTLVFIDITRIKKLENIRKDFIANLLSLIHI